MTYEEYKSRVIAAQEQWNTERAGIYNRQKSGNYASIFSGDTQPPHIGTPDNYDSLSLADMQAAVAAMKPKLVDDAVTAWANIGMNLMGTFYKFNQEFARTVTGVGDRGGWTGLAADAAVQAVNSYAEQSIPLSQAATAISLKLSEMRTGIEETQALMPGLTARESVTGKTLPGDGVMKVDEHNQQEATDEARRILRTVYGQVAVQTDNGVPFLPTAPTITDSTGDPGLTGGTGGANNAGTQDQSAGTGSLDETTADGTTPNSTDDGSSGDDTETSSTTPSATEAGTTTQSTTPQSTTAGSTTPGTTSTSPGTGTTPLGGGGSAGGSRGSLGSRQPGTPGSGNPGVASPGRSVPGNQSPGAAAAASRAGSAAGGRGATGMSGMGAPGAHRGGADDERTKGIPEYLITQENGDELIGADGIRTVPPVIGGDLDSASN